VKTGLHPPHSLLHFQPWSGGQTTVEGIHKSRTHKGELIRTMGQQQPGKVTEDDRGEVLTKRLKHWSFFYFFKNFLVVPGFELRALCLILPLEPHSKPFLL
jgi:hypothetical protein